MSVSAQKGHVGRILLSSICYFLQLEHLDYFLLM